MRWPSPAISSRPVVPRQAFAGGRRIRTGGPPSERVGLSGRKARLIARMWFVEFSLRGFCVAVCARSQPVASRSYRIALLRRWGLEMMDRYLSALASAWIITFVATTGLVAALTIMRRGISRGFGEQGGSSLYPCVASLHPERRHRAQIVPFRQYPLRPPPCAAVECTSHSVVLATAGSSLARNISPAACPSRHLRAVS